MTKSDDWDKAKVLVHVGSQSVTHFCLFIVSRVKEKILNIGALKSVKLVHLIWCNGIQVSNL